MIKISLIQTSQNRKDELTRFVSHLNSQVDIDLHEVQLIFVDQGDNREVFDNLCSDIHFVYIKTESCSLSHARNVALHSVQGKYIGFPDDDCWYEPDTLKLVLKVLEEEKYDGVSGKGTNENGLLTSSFPKDATEILPDKRCAAISYTLFFRYNSCVCFDENMGVGSSYNIGAGEETDYMLTLMEKYSYRIKYCPQLCVHHPIQEDVYDKRYLLNKYYSYARGAGYLLQKHVFPLSYYIKQYGRPFLGMLGYAVKGDFYKSKKSYYMLKGKIEGYLFNVKYNLGGGRFLKNTNLPIVRNVRNCYIKIRDYKIYLKRKKYLPLLQKHFPQGISIISNNCFAGRIYQDLHQPYLSPTAGLTILYPDFVTFVEKLEYYKTQPIEWVETSRYPRGEKMRKTWKHWYPIGLIGGDLEIHFLHYKTKEEALEKWKRRCGRINMNNLFVVAAAQGNCTEEMVARFSKLPYKKVFLVKEQYACNYPDVIYVKEFKKVGADPYRQAHLYYKYILNYLENKD